MDEQEFRGPRRAVPWIQVDEAELSRLQTISVLAAGLLHAIDEGLDVIPCIEPLRMQLYAQGGFGVERGEREMRHADDGWAEGPPQAPGG